MRALSVVFLIFATLACNSFLSIDESLEKIAQMTPIDQNNWEIVEKTGQGSSTKSYVLMQFKPDTTHILHFMTENTELQLFYHDIRFEDKEYEYYLSIKSDTLYFYKENKVDSTRIFIVGEYEYLSRNAKLTPKQRVYYRHHRDSLKSIRGNNLPELPVN